jgi:hypothetical protein
MHCVPMPNSPLALTGSKKVILNFIICNRLLTKAPILRRPFVQSKHRVFFAIPVTLIRPSLALFLNFCTSTSFKSLGTLTSCMHFDQLSVNFPFATYFFFVSHRLPLACLALTARMTIVLFLSRDSSAGTCNKPHVSASLTTISI